jgi:SsrA-binding protein
MKENINIVNRSARFEYEFIDTYSAGIMLTGVEVKFIRDGKLSFVDSFCTFQNGELFMNNVSISGIGNDNIKRNRKLLLKKKELNKLLKDLDKGLTIVPIRIYTNDDFAISTATLLYYRKPINIQITGCGDPYTGLVSTTNIPCEFRDDITEILIDAAASIMAGDIESFNQFTRTSQASETNT